MKIMEAGDRKINGMDDTVVEMLRRTGPSTVDDLAQSLPGDCFAPVFLTVDRLSREGVVRLVPLEGGYRVMLAD